ncbi:MAG: hypothetical protein R3Y64_09675 [Peptostreptococcaceae bacterium]
MVDVLSNILEIQDNQIVNKFKIIKENIDFELVELKNNLQKYI